MSFRIAARRIASGGTAWKSATIGVALGTAAAVGLTWEPSSGHRSEWNFGPRVALAASVPIGGGRHIGTSTVDTLPEQDVEDGLCQMVFAGEAEKLRRAVEEADLPDALVNTFGEAGVSPAMLAAYMGDITTLNRLLDAGASSEARSELPLNGRQLWQRYFPPYAVTAGLRAVEFAALGGREEALKLLIARGAADPTLAVKGDAADPSVGDDQERPEWLPPGWKMISSRGTQTGGNSNPAKGKRKPLDHYIRISQATNTGDQTVDDKKLKSMLRAIEEGKAMRSERIRKHRAAYPLEARLSQHLIGQRHAIQVVSNAIRRKENGWVDSDSPLVMLFMGSSGIGKTETAKQVAKYLHGSDTNEPNSVAGSGEGSNEAPAWSKCFVRVDMSEFQSKHEVSKFIGAPPGYVGYQEGGQLTKKLTECPHNAVVLLDEVEKAHPDVLTVMLAAFDEGRITDGQGETVDCRDALFIMTTNLAQQEIADEAVRIRAAAAARDGASTAIPQTASASTKGRVSISNAAADHLITKTFKRNVVQPILRGHFGRDEFLGRINETVFFLPFTEGEVRGLANKELFLWADRAKRRHNIELSWSPEVEELVAEGYDLRYGARSVKYEVDRMCIAPIAKAHEEGVVAPNCDVRLDLARAEVEGVDGLPSGASEALGSTPPVVTVHASAPRKDESFLGGLFGKR